MLFGSTISLFLVPSSYVVLEDIKSAFTRTKAEPTPRDLVGEVVATIDD